MIKNYHQIELLQSLQGGLGSVLAQLIPRRKELAGGILVGDSLAVHHLHAVDPGQDQVLGNLGPQPAHPEQTHAGGAESLLGVQTPQPDISITLSAVTDIIMPKQPDLTIVQLRLLLRDVGDLRSDHRDQNSGKLV